MKRLLSFSITSTFTFILSVLAILVIAVSAPGIVQAVLGPVPTSSGDVQPGNAIQESSYYGSKVNPAANFGSLTDNGTAAYMGIGIASPVSPLHIYSTISTQPETIDLSGTQPITAQWNDYCSTGGAFSGSGFLARFARGTKASPANVQVGDRLGFNVFGGWVGTGFSHTAAIEAMVDSGTVSGTSLPTYMRFSTTPSGSTTRLERMRIDSAGRVGINTTSPDGGAKLHVLNDNATVGSRAIFGEAGGGTSYGYLGGNGVGVYGLGIDWGVYGSNDNGGTAVYGLNTGSGGYAMFGSSTSGTGIYGRNTDSGNYGYLGGSNGAYGYSNSSYAGYFDGKVKVNGSFATAFRLVSSNSTVTATDSIIAVDASGAPLTITLPTAAGIAGRQYTIKKVDISGNAVTVACNGAEKIDGVATKSLGSQWSFGIAVSDGANWLIVGGN